MRSAAIRALRTFAQGAIATLTAFYLAVKDNGTFIDLDAHGEVLAFGFFLSFVAGVISFIQNLLEDRAGVTVIKG